MFLLFETCLIIQLLYPYIVNQFTSNIVVYFKMSMSTLQLNLFD